MTMEARTAVVALACALLVLWCLRQRIPVELVSDAHGNEVLLVKARLGGHKTVFMIDTAYAGAPVISTSFLAVEHTCAPGGSVAAKYRAYVDEARYNVTDNARHAAVRDVLLARRRCQAYTSGCTMRLMGIGTTQESQADMLLCHPLRLGWSGAHGAIPADVLVTHPLPGTPHILTMDYLMHRAPAVLRMGAGEMVLHARAPPVGYEFHAPVFVGGAPAIPMRVGGVTLSIVLDTGAAAPLSLSAKSALRVQERRTLDQHITQVGVNGERVCSDAFSCEVVVGGHVLGAVTAFANNHDVQGADGYAGLGLLRAFDLWLEPARVGTRPSGLHPRTPTLLRAGSCGRD